MRGHRVRMMDVHTAVTKLWLALHSSAVLDLLHVPALLAASACSLHNMAAP
jgi:hypothetical protein